MHLQLMGNLPKRCTVLNAADDIPEQVVRRNVLANDQETVIKTLLSDAFDDWKSSVDMDLLLKAIEEKDEKLLLEAINYDELIIPDIDIENKTTLDVAATFELAAQLEVTGDFIFDNETERITEFLDTIFEKRLDNLTNQAKKSILEQYKLGMNVAANPEILAKDIRDNIALNSRQAKALAKYQIALQKEDLPGSKIAELVKERRSNMLDYRAQMIARTETTKSIGFGVQEYGMQIVDADIFDASEVSKEWVSVMDNRTSQGCIERDGTIVLLLAEFIGGIMYPPGHVNCRSDVIIVFLKNKK